MPASKINGLLEFDEDQWVVSLINTKMGLKDLVGGHAKIIVEGVIKNGLGLMNSELFIAEYHIMEANRIPKESWIPQALRNTKCNYMVLTKEENHYNDRQNNQYKEVSSQSWHAKSTDVKKMIENIKEEERQINIEGEKRIFEYFGKWSIFSSNYGHNCTTWTEEKLSYARIGHGELLTDSFKATPSLHVSKCIIL